MKVSELEGQKLDYWVARAEGHTFVMRGDQPAFEMKLDPEQPHNEIDWQAGLMYDHFNPSRYWLFGGPLVELHGVTIMKRNDGWLASCGVASEGDDVASVAFRGTTALEAAMRAVVHKRYGFDVLD